MNPQLVSEIFFGGGATHPAKEVLWGIVRKSLFINGMKFSVGVLNGVWDARNGAGEFFTRVSIVIFRTIRRTGKTVIFGTIVTDYQVPQPILPLGPCSLRRAKSVIASSDLMICLIWEVNER